MLWQRGLALYAVLIAAAAVWFLIFWTCFDFWKKRRTLTYFALGATFISYGVALAVFRDWILAGKLDPPSIVVVIGWAVMVIATVLGTVADRQIGFRVRSFTPFFEKRGHLALKTDGAYGVVRHPIYASGSAFQLGAFLVTGYPTVLVAWVIFTFGAMWFTSKEEERLVALLADPTEYDRYRERVPALLPHPRRH